MHFRWPDLISESCVCRIRLHVRHSLCYLVRHLAFVTVRPKDLTRTVYRTTQLVYGRAKKTN